MVCHYKELGHLGTVGEFSGNSIKKQELSKKLDSFFTINKPKPRANQLGVSFLKKRERDMFFKRERVFLIINII
ncbi:MAG: hypothetical protein K0S34_2378 [Bacillales bacterium]|jgi:hypothetical protein|nr:hypothetical protein [Bacillales bacterium]